MTHKLKGRNDQTTHVWLRWWEARGYKNKQMSDYRSLFTRSREASFPRHLATSTTTDHQHFHYNGIEISSNSVHVCVLPFPALITHTADYITLKLSVAVSICLLGSVLFTLQLAYWFPYLLTQVLQSLAWLSRSRSAPGTVYNSSRHCIQEADPTQRYNQQPHTLTHTQTACFLHSRLTVLPVSAVSCSIEIVKKRITLLRLTVSKGGDIKWKGVRIFLGVRARALVYEAFLFILPLLL